MKVVAKRAVHGFARLMEGTRRGELAVSASGNANSIFLRDNVPVVRINQDSRHAGVAGLIATRFPSMMLGLVFFPSCFHFSHFSRISRYSWLGYRQEYFSLFSIFRRKIPQQES